MSELSDKHDEVMGGISVTPGVRPPYDRNAYKAPEPIRSGDMRSISESGESFLGENDYRELLLECAGLLEAMCGRFTTWAEVKVMRQRIESMLDGLKPTASPHAEQKK